MLEQCWASVVDGGPTLGQRLVSPGSVIGHCLQLDGQKILLLI